ncbi:hypothetical protein ACRALDRAFT_1066160 [Sodiomyces alcalophilus JCM 7366]|uniref:uncharacterized protein n=1 Tax=Sodiomyces alcalophilus JCM 7366 TaxID=591952 RepID=UPI0039B65584
MHGARNIFSAFPTDPEPSPAVGPATAPVTSQSDWWPTDPGCATAAGMDDPGPVPLAVARIDPEMVFPTVGPEAVPLTYQAEWQPTAAGRQLL